MAIRIGIMSFAHMHAFSYASAINKMPDAVLAGIADDNEARGREMAEKLQTKFFPSYEALLHQDIDAVVIASENIKHKELALMAAKAGKHALCEKPIATTVEDAQTMIDAFKDKDLRLMTAFPCRYSASTIRMKEQLDSGAIGDVLAIKGTNHGKMPGGWFIETEKSGGGAVIDHTVHVTDLMRWATGCEPVEVYAEISNGMHHDVYDDCGMLTITFDSGIISTLDTSWTRPKSFPTWGDVTMQIIGTKGILTMDMFGQTLAHYSDATMSTGWHNWGGDIDYAMIEDFVNSIAKDLPVNVTGEDGLKALAVALAAYESSKSGMPEMVNV